MASGATALVIAGLGITGAFSAFRAVRTTPEIQQPISSSNLRTLRVAWTASVGPNPSLSYSTLSGATLFIGSEDGNLYAFPASCQAQHGTCSPLWVGRVGAPVQSPPVVAGGIVYVAGGRVAGPESGVVAAFPASCGRAGGVCHAVWSRSFGQGVAPMGPVLDHGVLYALGPGRGLSALDAATGATMWTGVTPKGLVSTPVVAGGLVYSSPYGGPLYAFASSCRSPDRTCRPVGRRPLQPWASSDAPELAAGGGNVYVIMDGRILAVPASCAGRGGCPPAWTAEVQSPTGSSAAAVGDRLYVGTESGQILAFSATCETGGRPCVPMWTGTTHGPILAPASVLGDVVVVPSGDGDVYAFPANCASRGSGCDALWAAAPGGIPSAPAVSSTTIFVSSNDGRVRAFMVQPTSANSSTDTLYAIGTYAVIAALIGAFVIRRARDRSRLMHSSNRATVPEAPPTG
jgi:outer membrane protein assembly factor BamB